MSTSGKNPFPFAHSIGPAIRNERQKQELSDNKFAQRAGVSRRHLAELQKGSNVTLMVAFKAMQALGLREISHDFDGEKLTLKVTQAAGETLLRTAEEMDRAVALLVQSAALLRAEASAGGQRSEPPASTRLAAKAAAAIDDFGADIQRLGPKAALDALQRLAYAASAQPPDEHRPAARTAKRRKKTS